MEIYNQTLPVRLKGRSAKTSVSPSYIPDAESAIVWTTTIDNADPDFDEATSTTTVVIGEYENHGDDDDHEDN